MRRPLSLLVTLVAAAALPAPAAAWWQYGHETVANIAMKVVRPTTRAAILAILRHQAALQTPTCPARTIDQAAVWPDCIKALGDRFSYATSWHYQDPEICQPFDVKADCADGNCVSRQIGRAQRMTADTKLPWRDRVAALAFLIHFVGDIHQPLHSAAHDNDRGGNNFKADYGARHVGNLHSIWDGLLAERAIGTAPKEAAGILSEVPADQRAVLAAGTVDDWGRESWALAKIAVYGALEADPCGPEPTTAVVMDEATVMKLIPVVRLQIAKAGLRLGRLLDEALDGNHPEVAHPPQPAPAASAAVG